MNTEGFDIVSMQRFDSGAVITTRECRRCRMQISTTDALEEQSGLSLMEHHAHDCDIAVRDRNKRALHMAAYGASPIRQSATEFSKIPEYGAQFRARRALGIYAETFPGGGIKEAETLEDWYVRTAPKLTSPQARPFAALLREMTSIALATPVDELDALVEKAKHGRVGAPHSPIACADPMCRLCSQPPHANPVPRKYGTVVLDPNRMVRINQSPAPTLTLGEQRKADEAKKKADGWKGSAAYGFDSDID